MNLLFFTIIRPLTAIISYNSYIIQRKCPYIFFQRGFNEGSDISSTLSLAQLPTIYIDEGTSDTSLYFPNKKLLQKPSIPMIPKGAFTLPMSKDRVFQRSLISLFRSSWNCVDYLIVASLDIQLGALWQVDILAVDKGATNNTNWP